MTKRTLSRPISYALLAAALLILALIFVPRDAEMPPTTEVISKATVKLWNAREYAKLERYLTTLSKKFPKRVACLVASAIVDDYYHGRYERALLTINRIGETIEAKSITSSRDFGYHLGGEAWKRAQMEDIFKAMNTTAEEYRRNASPGAVQEVYGGELPGLLILLSEAPDADLP